MAETHADTKEKTIRAFFAICPDEIAQQRLAQLAKQLEPLCEGRKVSTQSIHLTLVFLGAVNASRLDALHIAIKTITAKSFDFSVETIHYWKHNRIVYAAGRKRPTELLVLVDALRNALSAAGFSFDPRVYVPHITLVRKAARPAATDLIKPINWRVQDWVLMQSKQVDRGVNYIPLGRWPLQ